MPIIAGSIMAGGALLGASASLGASRRATRSAENIFRVQQAMQQPYMNIGNMAMNPLAALYGINAGFTPTGSTGVSQATPEQQQAAMQLFYNSPEYTIQKQALDQALMRQASQTGTMYSPSTAVGQAEIAGRTFSDWRNNLASLANMGPQAAQITSANLGNMGQAQNQALGMRVQGMNQIGDMLQGIGGQVGQYNAYNRQMGQLNNLYGGTPNYNVAPLQTFDQDMASQIRGTNWINF